MTKMYIMGKYTEKAFQGFLKDPTTDRRIAVEKLTSAAGGKMLSMDIVRGSYDFIVVAEMGNFETFAFQIVAKRYFRVMTSWKEGTNQCKIGHKI